MFESARSALENMCHTPLARCKYQLLRCAANNTYNYRSAPAFSRRNKRHKKERRETSPRPTVWEISLWNIKRRFVIRNQNNVVVLRLRRRDIIFASKTREANITRRSRITLQSNRTLRQANITEKPLAKASGFSCIAPPKKILLENPYGIRDFSVFYVFFATSARFKQNHRNYFLSAKKDITLF